MIRPPRISPFFPTTPLSRSKRRVSPRRSKTRRRPRSLSQPSELHEIADRDCARAHHVAVQRHAPAELPVDAVRSEEHTSELQSQSNLVCRLLLEKKKNENASLQQPTNPTDTNEAANCAHHHEHNRSNITQTTAHKSRLSITLATAHN